MTTSKTNFDEGIKYTYFQYFKDLEFPIYIRVCLADFDPDLEGFVREIGFTELKEAEEQRVWSDLKMRSSSRLLTISEASTVVAKQIEMAQESDKYGHESIIPKNGYGVYRYKNVAMMVYSLASHEWQLGVFSDFGSPRIEFASRAVLNRFLAWALSPLGIVGFWGSLVDEGAVVMKQSEAKGEVVFFDIVKKMTFSMDGHKKMRRRFKLMKLSESLKNRNMPMSPEELMSFLSVNCCYFDHRGQSVAIRQLIQTVARECEGLIHPKESFAPRASANR